MGTVKVSMPHISWRKGRPRFEPGPAVRALGFKGHDLRHADGSWFNLDEAGAFASDIGRQIAERRDRKAAGLKLMPVRRPKHQTIEGLFEEWFASPWFTGETQGRRAVQAKAPGTVRDYRYKVNALRAFDAALMQEPPGAVTAVVAQGIFDELWEAKGLHTARGVVAVCSACWKWAKGRGRGGITINPWLGLSKPMPKPRLVTWSDQAVLAFVAAADLLGRPEMGDAVYLGLLTGQRQRDRLELQMAGRDDAGRIHVKQAKTAAVVAIPPTPQLVARLDAAESRRKARVASAILARGSAAARRAWSYVVIDETANAPFKSDWYRHVFAEIRTAAVRGLVQGADGTPVIGPEKPPEGTQWLLPPCPALAGLRDQDLRDTAVTWLGRAGCTVPEIASITGHSYGSIHNVLKHYLALHPDMADAAIGKLISWMKQTGIAV